MRTSVSERGALPPGTGEAPGGDDAPPAPSAGRSGPRRRDAAATRARILKAASLEFAQYGFGGARGDRIARRARSSERMVYYYFGNKQGLFREVLEAAYQALAQAEQGLVLDDLPASEALGRFCRFVWRWYHAHPEFIGVLTVENQQQARHLRRSPNLDSLVAPVVRMLELLLARGVSEGVFRDGLDAVALYVSIAGLGYFRVSNRYTLSTVLGRDLGESEVLEAQWQAAEEMVLRYVGARIQSAG